MVVRPQGHAGDSRFPPSVLISIAQSLAENVALRTLAHLNNTCRKVHQVTLPALYETLRLEDTKALLRSMRGKDLKGFQHTKYLILNQELHLLLQHHIRYTRHTTSNWENDVDFSVLFPHLVFLFTTDSSERGSAGHLITPTSIVLFKPIALGVLLDRCTPSEDDGMARRLTFYDVGYDVLGTGHKKSGLGYWPHERLFESVDITDLRLKAGAGLLPPVGILGCKKMNLKRDGQPILEEEGGIFRLTIDSDSPDPSLRATARIVLEYINFVMANDSSDDHQIYFELTCWPAILETFAKILFAAQPAPFRKLDIKLQGNDTTSDNMKRHIQLFAEHYAQGFKHGYFDTGCFPNVEIQATTPVPKLYKNQTRDKDLSELEGFVTAELVGSVMDYFGSSCIDYGNIRKEFTCTVEVGYNIRGSREKGKTVWKKTYPSKEGLGALVDDLSLGDSSNDDWTDEE